MLDVEIPSLRSASYILYAQRQLVHGQKKLNPLAVS